MYQVHLIIETYIESVAHALNSCLMFKRCLWETSLQSLFLLGRVILLASEGLWHRGRLSLENKALGCLMFVLINKLWSPLGDCATLWTIL